MPLVSHVALYCKVQSEYNICRHHQEWHIRKVSLTDRKTSSQNRGGHRGLENYGLEFLSMQPEDTTSLNWAQEKKLRFVIKMIPRLT